MRLPLQGPRDRLGQLALCVGCCEEGTLGRAGRPGQPQASFLSLLCLPCSSVLADGFEMKATARMEGAVSMATGACSRVSHVKGLHLIVFPCQESLVTCPFLSSHLIGLNQVICRDKCLRPLSKILNCGSCWRHRRMGPKTLGKVVEDQKLSHRPLSCSPLAPRLGWVLRATR